MLLTAFMLQGEGALCGFAVNGRSTPMTVLYEQAVSWTGLTTAMLSMLNGLRLRLKKKEEPMQELEAAFEALGFNTKGLGVEKTD